MDFTNITFNGTDLFDPDDSYTLEIEPMEILNAITASISFLANLLIIFVIARYSKLQTRPNLYLLNWCVCNTLVMLIVLILAFLNFFGVAEEVSYELMCVWEETVYGVLFGNLVFVVILLVDWYVAMYSKGSCLNRCERLHIFIMILVWIAVVSISVASVSFCMLNWSYPLTMGCFILGYWVIFIVILIVYVLRCVKIKIFKASVEKSKLELIIVTSYFLCWLPNWIYMYGQLFLRLYFSTTSEHFTYLLGYSHAWVMLILLYFCDKMFKIHIRRTFGLKEQPYRVNDIHVNREQNTGLL